MRLNCENVYGILYACLLYTSSDEAVLEALDRSIHHKVEHHLLNEGAAPIERDMNKIGG